MPSAVRKGTRIPPFSPRRSSLAAIGKSSSTPVDLGHQHGSSSSASSNKLPTSLSTAFSEPSLGPRRAEIHYGDGGGRTPTPPWQATILAPWPVPVRTARPMLKKSMICDMPRHPSCGCETNSQVARLVIERTTPCERCVLS